MLRLYVACPLNIFCEAWRTTNVSVCCDQSCLSTSLTLPLQKPSPAATAPPWWPEFTTCRPASQPIGRTGCAPTSKNAASNYTIATPTPRVSTRRRRSTACVTVALRATVGITASARKCDGRFFYYTSSRSFIRWLFLKFSQLSWPSPCARPAIIFVIQCFLSCYIFCQFVFVHVSLYVIPTFLFSSNSAPSARNL